MRLDYFQMNYFHSVQLWWLLYTFHGIIPLFALSFKIEKCGCWFCSKVIFKTASFIMSIAGCVLIVSYLLDALCSAIQCESLLICRLHRLSISHVGVTPETWPVKMQTTNNCQRITIIIATSTRSIFTHWLSLEVYASRHNWINWFLAVCVFLRNCLNLKTLADWHPRGCPYILSGTSGFFFYPYRSFPGLFSSSSQWVHLSSSPNIHKK